MRLRLVAAFSMTLGILAATIGSAGPVSAAPAVWEMPNVRQTVLKAAIKAVKEVAGPAELKLRIVDLKNGQDVMNESNWLVCAQFPRPGETISQKTKRVSLYVKRFNQKRCS
ncbi:MAG: hypothetical protein ACPGXI_06655 [Mycobacterium sp.]